MRKPACPHVLFCEELMRNKLSHCSGLNNAQQQQLQNRTKDDTKLMYNTMHFTYNIFDYPSTIPPISSDSQVSTVIEPPSRIKAKLINYLCN